MFGDRIPIRKGDSEWNWAAEENGDDSTIKKNERRVATTVVLWTPVKRVHECHRRGSHGCCKLDQCTIGTHRCFYRTSVQHAEREDDQRMYRSKLFCDGDSPQEDEKTNRLMPYRVMRGQEALIRSRQNSWRDDRPLISNGSSPSCCCGVEQILRRGLVT